MQVFKDQNHDIYMRYIAFIGWGVEERGRGGGMRKIVMNVSTRGPILACFFIKNSGG